MLTVGWGIKYFQKEATIASYLKANKDTYTNMQFDAYSTADVTAKRNRMTIAIKAETDDKKVTKEMKEYYAGEDAQKTLKEIGAYYLVTIKPQTRAIYADARVSVTLNGEELAKTDLTTFDADRIMNGTYYNDIEGKDKEKTEEDTGEAMEVEVNEDGTVVIPDEGEESNGNE